MIMGDIMRDDSKKHSLPMHQLIGASGLAAAAVLLPTAAMAHTSQPLGGVVAGLVHPFGGIDHVLAMIAVGIWAMRCGGRAVWAVPGAFLFGMAISGLAAFAGPPLVMVEIGVLGSLSLLGAAILLDWRPGLAVAAIPVAMIGALHGYAHAVELPAAAAPAGYAVGFLAATALLLGTGMMVAWASQALRRPQALRAGGGAIAASGLLLFVT